MAENNRKLTSLVCFRSYTLLLHVFCEKSYMHVPGLLWGGGGGEKEGTRVREGNFALQNVLGRNCTACRTTECSPRKQGTRGLFPRCLADIFETDCD